MQWRDLNQQIFAVLVAVALITLLLSKLFQRILDKNRAAKEAERQRLHILANYGSITGLPNRNLLLDRIEQAKRLAQRQRTRFAVCYVDLDDFKSVNDRFGHEAGDQLLRSVGTQLTALMRDSDTVARLHGDEFVVLLNNAGSDEDIEKVKAKIEAMIDQSIGISEHRIVMCASIGCAVFPTDGETAEQLLDWADKRMYREKHASKIGIVGSTA